MVIRNDEAERSRVSVRRRKTNETEIAIDLAIDGTGVYDVATGIPFFDHMVSQLIRHAGFDGTIHASGDLAVDTHHCVEDTGICLGEAFAEAMGDKAGVRRFASVNVPLDESLIAVALDLSGRPYLHYDVPFSSDVAPLGMPGFDPQLAEEFWRAFSGTAGITLHISLTYGKNIHHILESSFKAVARALRDAVRIDGAGVPSTKGVL